jgi:hypothetical protein
MLVANQGFALMPESRSLRRFLGGVRVAVHGQHPRLGQQRPREAEQQYKGDMGAKGQQASKDEAEIWKRRICSSVVQGKSHQAVSPFSAK